MELLSEWKLMEQGQFELAYDKITKHIAENPSSVPRYIYNRGLCLLNLEKPEHALLDFHKLIELRPDSDAGYISAGIALWWLKQDIEAVQTWKNAVNTIYTDAAGGITAPALLFFAAIKLHDMNLEKNAMELLKMRCTTEQIGAWPGPIAKFLLGNLEEADLFKKADQRPALKGRMLTKIYFWIGVSHLRQNSVNLYQHHLYQASLGHILEPEYYLAKVELQSFK